ncbi:MAG: winged helix-turn-helix transcriptional regulator [Thermoplasmatota archaeon]
MAIAKLLPILLLVAPLGLAQGDFSATDLLHEVLENGPTGPEGQELLPELLGKEEPEQTPEQPTEGDESFGGKFREAFSSASWAMGLTGVFATLFGVVGFGLVTRYISPKEALKNPQRAMLYGFIRATPGAHLKQLSEEFQMKTSSILWHIRKLEAADLVNSERANGFRVFYPVEGGVEAKKLSRAMTALQNENARRIQELVSRRPGLSVKDVSERLTILGGTVRWHLRKLREFGLMDELVSDEGSLFYGTPLGEKAMAATVGMPVAKTAPKGTPAEA